MKKPDSNVILVLSSTRSGSTWLGYVLGSCADSAFLGEYYRAWDDQLRQPCAWCAANGRPDCEVLGGIESIPRDQAFPFAFVRTGARNLVDASKSVEWAGTQVEAQKHNSRDGREIPYQIRAVHLIRDPRGWYASERRRTRLPLDQLMRKWVADNERIAAFLSSSGMDSVTAFYEDLAGDPETTFRDLCGALHLQFRAHALRYWEQPHHGYATNGASASLLAGLPSVSAIQPYFITGDDQFYSSKRRKSFVDQRWMSALTASECERICNAPGVHSLLDRYDRSIWNESPVPSCV